MGTTTTKPPKKKLPPPGRKMSFKEAVATTMAEHKETLAKLAK
jgi:hypothetical protein